MSSIESNTCCRLLIHTDAKTLHSQRLEASSHLSQPPPGVTSDIANALRTPHSALSTALRTSHLALFTPHFGTSAKHPTLHSTNPTQKQNGSMPPPFCKNQSQRAFSKRLGAPEQKPNPSSQTSSRLRLSVAKPLATYAFAEAPRTLASTSSIGNGNGISCPSVRQRISPFGPSPMTCMSKPNSLIDWRQLQHGHGSEPFGA